MVFCAEEQIMKLYDEMPTTFWQNTKQEVTPHAYLMKEPTRNYSYSRPGGILVFLQNNNNKIMLSVILQQPLYHEILKCISIENQGVTL